MRHALPETILLGVIDSGQGDYHLTPSGKKRAEEVGKKLKKEKIDFIVSSDILRAKETAEGVAKHLGVPVHFDKRLREIYLADMSGKPSSVYHAAFPTFAERFMIAPEKGETLRDVRSRSWDAFMDLEKKYEGKRILIISHESPIWMLDASAGGWDETRSTKEREKMGEKRYLDTGAVRPLIFVAGPRNNSGELDLHRPYIDEIVLDCKKCGALFGMMSFR